MVRQRKPLHVSWVTVCILRALLRKTKQEQPSLTAHVNVPICLHQNLKLRESWHDYTCFWLDGLWQTLERNDASGMALSMMDRRLGYFIKLRQNFESFKNKQESCKPHTSDCSNLETSFCTYQLKLRKLARNKSILDENRKSTLAKLFWAVSVCHVFNHLSKWQFVILNQRITCRKARKKSHFYPEEWLSLGHACLEQNESSIARRSEPVEVRVFFVCDKVMIIC